MLPTQIILCVLCASNAWQPKVSQDGLVLEVQTVENSGFERIRVRGTSRASAEHFAKTWWGKAADISANPAVSRREVLLDHDTERLVYDEVPVPLGTDRDYVLRVVLKHDDKSGTYSVLFRTVDDKRKPINKDHVRMQIEAFMTATPDAKGGCRFVYTVFADVGGALPAFLLGEPQRKGTLQLAQQIRQRAETGSGVQ